MQEINVKKYKINYVLLHNIQEVDESFEELDEESARILALAGITNEAQSAAQKAAFAKMIAKKNGGKSEDKADDKDDNKKPDEDGDGIPDWVKGEKKVDEGILASTRALWKKYQE